MSVGASLRPMKKVLMLHGYAQSDVIFRAKTAGMRKLLSKRGYELYYPCGPYPLASKDFHSNDTEMKSPTDSTNSSDIYGWFVKDHETQSFKLQPEMLEYLKNYIEANGPFEGIMGFSQGASLAGYLATDFSSLLSLNEQIQPNLKFAVFFSGFRMDPEEFQQQYENNPISFPTLHVVGELDTLVPEEKSLTLYEICPESTRTLLKHSGGHYIPNSKPFIANIINWLEAHTSEPDAKKESELAPDAKAQPDTKPKPQLDDDLLNMIDSLGKM